MPLRFVIFFGWYIFSKFMVIISYNSIKYTLLQNKLKNFAIGWLKIIVINKSLVTNHMHSGL